MRLAPPSKARAREQPASFPFPVSSVPSSLLSLFPRISVVLLCLLSFSQPFVSAQNGPVDWGASPFNPPALPLAVKTPYLNTWVAQGNRPSAANAIWPNLWTIGAITGWYSSVTVDGTPYRILGDVDASRVPNVNLANQTAIEFTATRTTFIFTAGPMQINASFITPIEPTDFARQSVPFSYYTMSASSLDGSAHTLRMYSDISGEFITGDTAELATWDAEDSGQYIVLSMELETPQAYTELNSHAQDAVEYYAFRKLSGTTASWAITEDNVNRNRSANMTSLGNEQDRPPRGVDVSWPTLGIAVDWESVTDTPEPAVWTIGVVRSPAIQYRTPANEIQDQYPYFLTQWDDGPTAAKAFLDDFTRASQVSADFDSRLSAAGNQISSEYADLLALSARQVMSALDITLSRTGDGEWNFTDTKIFMKNTGSAGSDAGTSGVSITSVNTVDTLYAALPAFLYLNPEITGHLLSPLLEFQDSDSYTQTYAARNLGTAYPNATANGITDTHDYRIEETASMLILTLAYSQRSGNGTFLSRHYGLLRGWAEYLESNAMSPTNERSADFTPGMQVPNFNQTNLVLKGIIGIACMGRIAELAGVSSDQQRFNDSAKSFFSQWEDQALAPDSSHINFLFGDVNTNGLIYNLYADKLLQLGLVSDQVYEVATVFYNNVATQARYGLPLNNEDPDRTGTHWMAFSAATVTNPATRDYMINQVHDYASSNQNNTPFPVYYNPGSGAAEASPNAGKSSPAIGGVFAFLGLNTTIQSDITIPQEGSTIPGDLSPSSSSNAGAIAGGVIGSLAGAGLLGFGIFFCLRRHRRIREQEMFDTRVEPNPMTIDIRSPTSYDNTGGRPKLAGFGFSDGTTFEPLRYGGPTSSGSASTPHEHSVGGVGGAHGTNYSNGVEAVLPYTSMYDAGGVATSAQNVRDSTYFRTHRPGEGDDIGLSASQVGSATTSSGRGSSSRGGGSSRGGSSRGGGGGRGGVGGEYPSSSGRGLEGNTSGSLSDGTAPQQVLLAKQTLVNEELRSEVDNLRRDLERIREERRLGMGLGVGVSAGRPVSNAFSDEAPPEYDGPGPIH